MWPGSSRTCGTCSCGNSSRKLTETPAELHTALRSARPREYTSAGRIGTLLADQYNWSISTDEILYLALHVSRLVDAAAVGRATP
jgi:beta-glucoside operon transcriptional antiterminator